MLHPPGTLLFLPSNTDTVFCPLRRAPRPAVTGTLHGDPLLVASCGPTLRYTPPPPPRTQRTLSPPGWLLLFSCVVSMELAFVDRLWVIDIAALSAVAMLQLTSARSFIRGPMYGGTNKRTDSMCCLLHRQFVE